MPESRCYGDGVFRGSIGQGWYGPAVGHSQTAVTAGGPSLCDGVGVASCSLRGSTPRGSESERPRPRAGGASVRQGHCGRPRKSHQGSLGAESSPCKGTGVGRQSDVCGEQSKEGPKGRGVVEAG